MFSPSASRTSRPTRGSPRRARRSIEARKSASARRWSSTPRSSPPASCSAGTSPARFPRSRRWREREASSATASAATSSAPGAEATAQTATSSSSSAYHTTIAELQCPPHGIASAPDSRAVAPQLALRLDVLLIQLYHSGVALLRQLQVAQGLGHVAEEEVRRQAALHHLQCLPAVAGALLERLLAVLGEEELRVAAPGVEFGLVGVHLDGLLEQIQALLVLAGLDEDLRLLEVLLRGEDAGHVHVLRL